MPHKLRKRSKASVKLRPSLLNETVSSGGCIFCCSTSALGRSVSCQNLVARSTAVAMAGAGLSKKICAGWDLGKGNRSHNAPLTYWLLHWTGGWPSAGAVDRALEIVWRYDWNHGTWTADVAQRLLGAFGTLVVWPD